MHKKWLSKQSTSSMVATSPQAIACKKLAYFFLVMNLLVDSFPALELWKSLLSVREDHIRSEAGREFFRRFAK
jgi:hypothetical protein